METVRASVRERATKAKNKGKDKGENKEKSENETTKKNKLSVGYSRWPAEALSVPSTG